MVQFWFNCPSLLEFLLQVGSGTQKITFGATGKEKRKGRVFI